MTNISSHMEIPRSLDHPALQQCVQLQSVTGMCNQYHDLFDWVRQHHDDNFQLFQHQFQQQMKPKTAFFQPSWAQILHYIQNPSASSSTSITPPPVVSKPVSVGKTRLYRTRSLVPGFYNQERTFAKVYAKTVPETPSNLYQNPNVNRDDRHFPLSNQTIRIFQFTQSEWVEYARECLKTTTTKLNRCEPLMTYIRYVMENKGKGTSRTTEGSETRSDETKVDEPSIPNIFGPKLTNEQKNELLDAYYWVHMKHDESHKPVLFYYKLSGWFVRAKDGYRSTKSHDARQLILKRNELIQKGSIALQVKTKQDAANRVKSCRGRKRKVNV